jgi:hypothetical protein
VKRLGEASPRNDGKQTPFKGHPVFNRAARHGDVLPGLSDEMARHRKGPGATAAELEHIAAVIERWLRIQSAGIPEEPAQGRLL